MFIWNKYVHIHWLLERLGQDKRSFITWGRNWTWKKKRVSTYLSPARATADNAVIDLNSLIFSLFYTIISLQKVQKKINVKNGWRWVEKAFFSRNIGPSERRVDHESWWCGGDNGHFFLQWKVEEELNLLPIWATQTLTPNLKHHSLAQNKIPITTWRFNIWRER